MGVMVHAAAMYPGRPNIESLAGVMVSICGVMACPLWPPRWRHNFILGRCDGNRLMASGRVDKVSITYKRWSGNEAPLPRNSLLFGQNSGECCLNLIPDYGAKRIKAQLAATPPGGAARCSLFGWGLRELVGDMNTKIDADSKMLWEPGWSANSVIWATCIWHGGVSQPCTLLEEGTMWNIHRDHWSIPNSTQFFSLIWTRLVSYFYPH